MIQYLCNVRALGFVMLGIFAATGLAIAQAQQQGDTVQAHWKPQEIQFTYTGFTTAYDCDALASKVERILEAVGAHEKTLVTAAGCPLSLPSRTAFVRIYTATPQPASDHTKPTHQEMSRQELLDRLGVKGDFDREQFSATWQTIRLSENRRLDLRPGDCELMAQLRDQVFPKMGVKVTEENVTCTPHHTTITTPTLQVSALVPARTADTMAAEQ